MKHAPASHYLANKYDPDGFLTTLQDKAKALDARSFARDYHSEFEEFGRDPADRTKPVDMAQEKDDPFGGLIELLLNPEREDSTQDYVRAVANPCAAIDILSAYN
jgi:hypothetical protein